MYLFPAYFSDGVTRIVHTVKPTFWPNSTALINLKKT
jgi:hypothetical protein